jgi:hypothetical protein
MFASHALAIHRKSRAGLCAKAYPSGKFANSRVSSSRLRTNTCLPGARRGRRHATCVRKMLWPARLCGATHHVYANRARAGMRTTHDICALRRRTRAKTSQRTRCRCLPDAHEHVHPAREMSRHRAKQLVQPRSQRPAHMAYGAGQRYGCTECMTDHPSRAVDAADAQVMRILPSVPKLHTDFAARQRRA